MTNKEYIESRNLSFAEGLKLWNKDKYPDFSDWLKAEHTRKYKVGDVIEDRSQRQKYVVIGVDVKDSKTGNVYAYNTVGIYPDGRIKFVSNEGVESGNYDYDRSVLFSGRCDNDPDYVKIA